MIRIPDGVRLAGERGKSLAVFNPRWWRPDRWVFWAWMYLFRKSRLGWVTITGLETTEARTEIVSKKLRAYEV